MAFRPLLCLGLAAWVWPVLAAADVVDCSLSQARVDVSRLDIDNGSSLLFHQEDLVRFYPDRALRMGVGGMVLLACSRTDQGMDCEVREATPTDQNFEARSLRLMMLVPRRLRDTAIFRVDYTMLAVGTCFDPFHRVPDWRPGRVRRR